MMTNALSPLKLVSAQLGEELSDGEGPQRVMLGGLEMLLPKVSGRCPIRTESRYFISSLSNCNV